MPPKLYLLDGHALAYRTFFALTRGNAQGWTTRDGEPTAGVYGFTSVLLRILDQERPDYLMVAFDTGATFRDTLFPDYKATREKMPDDLITQMKRIRQIVDAFNIPRIEMEGYEADDVLGSLAKIAVSQGLGVKIITGDRDLLQLVDDRIIVSLPGKTLSDAKDYFTQDVIDFLGVHPSQVIDLKALVGDKSDNIPGVMGIGDKTAISLLLKYKDLDNIYVHLAEISEGVKKRLESGRDSAYLSRKLATIVVDLPVPFDLEKAHSEHFDPRKVEILFRELEFRTLFNRLTILVDTYTHISKQHGRQLSFFPNSKITEDSDRHEPSEAIESRESLQPQINIPCNLQQATTGQVQVTIIDSSESLAHMISQLENASVISFDTETTSTDQMKADLVGISLATGQGKAFYIPVGHVISGETQPPQLPLSLIINALRKPMTDAKVAKVGHNCKYDFVLLARNGLRVHPITFDTMIAEWIVNPTSRNLGLKNLAWVRQGTKMTEIETLIGKGKNQCSMAEVAIQDVAAYSGVDAEIIFHLMPSLQNELDNCQATQLFSTIEMPLIPVLAEMEMAGISLDIAFLSNMQNELSTRLNKIEIQIYENVGSSFNLNSPTQLSDALFGRLGLKPPDRSKRTATGFYSTAADVLDSMSGIHPVVDMVLEYRELSKLKSTYVESLPDQVNPNSGRVHTSYNQTGAVTGRIASSNPNLQNIPIRTEIGRQVRRAFIADKGQTLISVDYSQIELRIVAHMANDEAMLAAFRSGQDIHSTTAAAIYGIPLEAVTKEQRRRAKSINFGLIYGMSAFGLTRYTDLTLTESEDFVKAYFAQFPGVKYYLDGIRTKAAELGFVETLLGRRRYFPGLKNQTNQTLRGREEREAINAPIQGTAADIMKIAMLDVSAALRKAGLSGRMLLQVHDELVLECPMDELYEISEVVTNVMQKAYPLKVPLLTEARYGPNWYEMSKVDEEL